MAHGNVAVWLARLGLLDDQDAPRAVREALAVAPEPPDEDTMRLLAAAATNVEGGAAALVARLAAEPGRTVASLAAVVASCAAGTPHPWHVFAFVAKGAIDQRLGLMSDEAYGGMARLQAVSCRREVADEQFLKELTAERRSQRPLLETASWRAVVDRTAPREGWQKLFEALETRDVDGLVEAALSATQPQDSLTALGFLRGLDQKSDARLSADARARLLDGLRAQAANPNAYHAIEAWAQLDPPAYFAELAARADAAGVLDQRLFRFVSAKGLTDEYRRAAAAAFERIVRRQVALGLAPFQSLDWWLIFDRDGAASFLANDVDPTRLDARTARAVIRPLQALDTKDAVAMLRRIHAEGGLAAEDALLSLEVLEQAPQDRIEAVVTRFRAGEGRALRELHDRWIDRCSGRPFGVWRRRLGETAGERCFWARSRDGTASLFVETDKDDRLTGWSMR